MPERNNDFGKFGARGIKGHKAVARQLDALAGFVRPHHRVVEFRTLNVRHWDRIVEAWAAADQALDDAWINEAVVDLGSRWGQYEYVTTIGFAA
ncbi:hypothetical protein [Streptomyces olivochromogenes]|uniref:hypothetical protein n=1 Tax=Streptomyces olivochromogenes TaxID=1963 RepID=UPI0036BDBC9C